MYRVIIEFEATRESYRSEREAAKKLLEYLEDGDFKIIKAEGNEIDVLMKEQ